MKSLLVTTTRRQIQNGNSKEKKDWKYTRRQKKNQIWNAEGNKPGTSVPVADHGSDDENSYRPKNKYSDSHTNVNGQYRRQGRNPGPNAKEEKPGNATMSNKATMSNIYVLKPDYAPVAFRSDYRVPAPAIQLRPARDDYC